MANKLKTFLNRLFFTKIKQFGGTNNIEISKSAYLRKVKIIIYGSENTVVIKDNTYLHNVKIIIGFKDCHINGCKITIGEDTSFNSAYMQMGENDSTLTIGRNCMFSFNIEISCTDTHSITDLNGNLLNKGNNIEIGDNVWVCKNSVILKNTKISNNCIVAQGSIITGKFDKNNCVLAGIPAKIVKENIIWSRKRPQNFLDNGE